MDRQRGILGMHFIFLSGTNSVTVVLLSIAVFKVMVTIEMIKIKQFSFVYFLKLLIKKLAGQPSTTGQYPERR